MSAPLGIEQHVYDWPALSEGEIADILDAYDFGALYQKTLFQSKRPFSSASMVLLKGGRRIFIKKHASLLRPLRALEEEHRFLFFLARRKAGSMIAAPYRLKNGASIFVKEQATYEIFPPLRGEDAYQNISSWSPYLSLEHAVSSGRALAQFHQDASDYQAEGRDNFLLLSSLTVFLSEDFSHNLKNALLEMEPYGKELFLWLEREKYWEELCSYIGLFHQKIAPAMFHVKRHWGHGDWSGTNLSWKEGAVAQIFDLGMSNLTATAFDIAVAIERSFINWLKPFAQPAWHREQLQEFLKSYEKEYVLEPDERRLVGLFLPLCHITFALSEVIYYRFLLKQEENALIAYHSYAIGHLKWFLSEDGVALLSYLQEWAETSC